MATKAELLAAFTLPPPVPFEAGGQSFHLRALTAGDVLIVQRHQAANGEGTAVNMMFVRGVCDAAGVRLFDDADADTIGGLIGGPVDAVATKLLAISGLGGDRPKASSPETPNLSSSTGSPGT